MEANTKAFSKFTDPEFLKLAQNRVFTVGEMWENSVKRYSDKNAVLTPDCTISYSELDKQVACFRTVLTANGISKGDCVGIYIPNSIEFVKVYLAITTLGAVAVLLPPQLDGMTVFGCSMKFGLKALCYAESLAANTEFTKEKNADIKLINALESADISTPPTPCTASDPCTVIFTGGTTGKSKGSLLSHGAVMRGTENGGYGVAQAMEQRYILALPLTHVFGLIRNLLTALYTGSSLFICMNNKDLFRDIAVFKPTIIVLVPALAEMALQFSQKFGRNMLGESMKTIICGAAFVPPYLIAEYQKLGIALLPGYGLTESANLVSGNPEALKKPDSVGLLYPDIEARVVDGELWLRGPNMQDRYVGEPEENTSAYEDGFFKTGDLVRFDEDGFLYITGRKKEIIVLSSGENISPAYLEAKFAEIDAIQDCLVYENADGKLELEILVRMPVIAARNIENAQEYIRAEVAKINTSLPTYMRISKTVFRETDFIRSPSMKIIRSKNGYVKS